MARMLGKRTKHVSPFAQCKGGDCHCRTGSNSRKFDRRMQRKIEKQEFRKEMSNGE